MMQTSSPADSQGELGGNNVCLFLLLAETGGKGGGKLYHFIPKDSSVGLWDSTQVIYVFCQESVLPIHPFLQIKLALNGKCSIQLRPQTSSNNLCLFFCLTLILCPPPTTGTFLLSTYPCKMASLISDPLAANQAPPPPPKTNYSWLCISDRSQFCLHEHKLLRIPPV